MKPNQFARRIQSHKQFPGHEQARVRRSDSGEALLAPVIVVIFRDPRCWALAVPEAESVFPLYAGTIGRAQTVLPFIAKTMRLHHRLISVSELLDHLSRGVGERFRVPVKAYLIDQIRAL